VAEPENDITKQYQKFFCLSDPKLTLTEKTLRAMPKLSIETGTGARGLRAIIETVMLDVLYEFPDHAAEISEYVVTPELVRHGTFNRGKRVYKKDEPRRETA